MIGYITLGTNKLDQTAGFYDQLLAELQAQRVMEAPDFIVWSCGEDRPGFSIHLPADGGQASVGNGVMIALQAESRAQVDRLHARALELGGTDEGAPGLRHGDTFYAAYFRDPEGNKLNAHFMG